MESLTITIEGVAPSGNARNGYRSSGIPGEKVHVFNTDHTKSYMESAKYQALAQARAKRWGPVKYCWVAVSIYNHRYDRDNGVKVPNDALQGIAYENDAHILDGPIRLVKDAKGPRIMFTIIPIDPAWNGYAKTKEPPLTHKEWVDLHVAALFE